MDITKVIQEEVPSMLETASEYAATLLSFEQTPEGLVATLYSEDGDVVESRVVEITVTVISQTADNEGMSTQRQPKGTPTGGQFAASAHDDALSSLPENSAAGPEEIALSVAADWHQEGETRDSDIRLAMAALDADCPDPWRAPVDVGAALDTYVGDSDTSEGFDRDDMVTFARAAHESESELIAESVAPDWHREGETRDEDYRLALLAIESGRAQSPVDIEAALDTYVGDSDTSEGFDRDDMVTFATSLLHQD